MDSIRDDETVKTTLGDDDDDDEIMNTTEEGNGSTSDGVGPRETRNYARAGVPHKEGHSFCGCLCDMRRACIIIDIVNIAIAVIVTLMFVVAWIHQGKNDEINIDNSFTAASEDAGAATNLNGTTLWTTNTTGLDGEDDDDDEFEKFVRAWRLTVTGILLISVLSFIIGILGALRYSAGMVFCCGLWHCFLFTVNMLALNLLGALLNGLFAYPHFVLVHEIRQGIMNRDRYLLEKQSCCCV